MELNFKNIKNLLAVLDALVDEICEALSSDWYKYDRKEVENLESGKWGYLTIRTHGSDFTDSIRKHDRYVNNFSDVRFVALIIREDKDCISLSLSKR